LYRHFPRLKKSFKVEENCEALKTDPEKLHGWGFQGTVKGEIIVDGPFGWLTLFAIAGIAQSLLIVFIILVMKKNRRANIFYALFIIVFSSSIIPPLFHPGINLAAIYIFTLISVSGTAVSGSLLYFYSGFITDTIERFNLRTSVHFLPFFVAMGLLLAVLDPSVPFPEQSLRQKIFGASIFGSSILTAFIYTAVTFIRLKSYERQTRNYFSDFQRANVGWLRKVLGISLTFMGAWNIGFWIMLLGIRQHFEAGIYIHFFLFMAIIFITAYYISNQPELFRDSLEMKEALSLTGKNGRQKYARQNIGEAAQKKYLHELEEFIEREKPFLNENLTIKDLAQMTKIPVHHLSIVINNRRKMNFYAFINEYRVNEAIRILDENPDMTDASILSVAFRAGFNSKSTFNDAFKKVTGKTPSEYRSRLGAAS
jgi:AraC-like DNA-binding protein